MRVHGKRKAGRATVTKLEEFLSAGVGLHFHGSGSRYRDVQPGSTKPPFMRVPLCHRSYLRKKSPLPAKTLRRGPHSGLGRLRRLLLKQGPWGENKKLSGKGTESWMTRALGARRGFSGC